MKTEHNYKDGSNIFFTSDTHFGHANILKFCSRPYSDVNEMDKKLVDKWNETVPSDGLVFHLGDFAWGGFQFWKQIREQLNGKIILILGNHDWRNGCQSQQEYDKLFEHTSQQMFIEIEKRKVYLNHYPFLCYAGTYRRKKDLVYQLYGHVHSGENAIGEDIKRLGMLFPTQYDVGTDNNNYAPISWADVNDKIQKQIEKQ